MEGLTPAIAAVENTLENVLTERFNLLDVLVGVGKQAASAWSTTP